jgi:hypothetical protein
MFSLCCALFGFCLMTFFRKMRQQREEERVKLTRTRVVQAELERLEKWTYMMMRYLYSDDPIVSDDEARNRITEMLVSIDKSQDDLEEIVEEEISRMMRLEADNETRVFFDAYRRKLIAQNNLAVLNKISENDLELRSIRKLICKMERKLNN